ncbi:MAG TPA: histidine kinase [Vicinamibacterales bacterium]|jgi:signal transduction histidine kinase
MSPHFRFLRAPRWLVGRRADGVYQIDPQHAIFVAKILAAARLTFVVVGLIAVELHPGGLGQFGELPTLVLSAFVVFSVAVLVTAHLAPFAIVRGGLALHLVDLALIVVVTATTGGANSPFVSLFLYTLLSAGYRWGFPATILTGAFALVTALAAWGLHLWWGVGPHPLVHESLIRGVYIGVGALLIGFLAGEEQRQRLRSVAVARIMSRVTGEKGLVASVRAVLSDLLTTLAAPRGVLALEEDGTGRVYLWHVQQQPGQEAQIRLTREASGAASQYSLDVPPEVDALFLRRSLRTRHECGVHALNPLALDVNGTRIRRPCATSRGCTVAALCDVPPDWTTVYALPHVRGDGWRGRLIIFDSEMGGSRRNHLRFLQVVVRQVAPAVFNLYLQRRLESRSGAVERTTISRALHDGVIQSLIGVEMELEVLRRQPGAGLSPDVHERLGVLQGALAQEVLNVRDLMQMLKLDDVDPTNFVEHVADTVERFQVRTGIRARFLCDLNEVALPPRVCRQLAAIVQESLANVRKHSGAKNVVVRFAQTPDGWCLDVEDDGTGFDFEGRLSLKELASERRGPVIIKERVRSIGGQLTIDSRLGRGARLEITLAR